MHVPGEVVLNSPFEPRRRSSRKANLRHLSSHVSDIHRLLAEEGPTAAAYATELDTTAWQLRTLLCLFLDVPVSQLYGKYKPSARLLAIVAFAP